MTRCGPMANEQVRSCDDFFWYGATNRLSRGRGGRQRSDWGRHARTRSFDTLPADSGHLGPGGTPRAPLHTHTRTHSSVAHTRSSPRVEGGTNQEGNRVGRTMGGDIQGHRCPPSGWEEIGPRPVTTGPCATRCDATCEIMWAHICLSLRVAEHRFDSIHG